MCTDPCLVFFWSSVRFIHLVLVFFNASIYTNCKLALVSTVRGLHHHNIRWMHIQNSVNCHSASITTQFHSQFSTHRAIQWRDQISYLLSSTEAHQYNIDSMSRASFAHLRLRLPYIYESIVAPLPPTYTHIFEHIYECLSFLQRRWCTILPDMKVFSGRRSSPCGVGSQMRQTWFACAIISIVYSTRKMLA